MNPYDPPSDPAVEPEPLPPIDTDPRLSLDEWWAVGAGAATIAFWIWILEG